MKMSKKYVLIVSVLIFVGKVNAQNNASPYSIIGIGDIEKSSFDRTTGMGYAGVALSSSKSLFSINPASYSFLDDYHFNVETSIRYKAISYVGKPITDGANSSSADLVSKKIVFAIKIKPKWGFSFGLLPFSTTNYSFSAKKTVQGTGFTTDAYYEGSGSVNQAYIANSYRIAKGLSVGLQLSYLFGQQQQEETIGTDLSGGSLYTKRNISLSKGFAVAGIQYNTKLNKKWNIAFGATISNKTQLDATYSLLVQDGTQTIEDNEKYKSSYFTLPFMFTIGVAATLNDKYSFAVDYNHQDWNSAKNTGVNYTLTNSDRLSAGFQYSQKKPLPAYLQNYTNKNTVYEKSFFQAGIFYSNSYLKMYDQQLKDYGFTIGGGIHSSRGLGIQGALEVGQRGTTANGLIKENYTQFTLTLLYKEIWYGKRRYN
jgi:hypothetical protein